jgi:hypothetical protein
MKSRIICCVVFCLLAGNFVSVRAQDNPAAAWKPVETALGRSGQMQPGDVYKFALPRRDMKSRKSLRGAFCSTAGWALPSTPLLLPAFRHGKPVTKRKSA